MSAGEILKRISTLPVEDWVRIQEGIAQMLAAGLSSDDIAEISEALAEADQDHAQGRVISSEAMRRHFGLR